MGNAQHADAHFIEACVAQGNGAVVVEEEFVDGFAFFKSCQGAVLPEDGGYVGHSAQKPFVAAAEGPVAEFQTVFQDFPEAVHVAVGGAGHVHQVDGDYALVETAVVFMLAVGSKAFGVGGEEAAAAHAGVYVAVLQALHDFGGNVVRYHSLGGAFRSQLGEVVVGGIVVDVVFVQHVNELREGRGNPYALFILHTLHSLAEHFFDNHGQVFPGLSVGHFVQVHEHGDEGGLSVTGHEGDELVLDGLDAGFDFFLQAPFHNLFDDGFVHGFAGFFSFFNHFFRDFLAADVHKGRQMGQGEGLAAVLVGCHLGHDLGGHVAGGEEGMGLFNEGLADDGAVLQHVFQVDEVAVVFPLGEIVGVVEMDDAFFMGLHDFLRQQQSLGEILGHFAGHVVTLGGIDDRILIGIFLLHFLIGQVDEGQNAVVGGIALAGNLPLVAVTHILLGHFIAPHFHDARFHHVLDILHVHRMGVGSNLPGNVIRHGADLEFIHLVDGLHFLIRLANGVDDFGNIKRHFLPVTLYDVRFDVNNVHMIPVFHVRHSPVQ